MPYPLYEITSSGINRAYLNADERGPLRLGDLYRHENFGTVDIDWATGVVVLAVRDLKGQPMRQVAITISSLKQE